MVIGGANHKPPSFLNISQEMKNFISWYKSEGLTLHPIQRAAIVHIDFVKIHFI